MGSTKANIQGKNFIRSMLNFDVRVSLVIGFAFHWTWVWSVFWSSLFYSAAPVLLSPDANPILLEPLWVLSLITNALGYGSLFFFSKRCAPFGQRTSLIVCAAFLTTAGTVLIADPIFLLSSQLVSCGYVVGALLTGLGSAMGLVLWAELLTVLGARQTIVYSVSATVVGSALYFIITLMPPECARFFVSALPLVEMGLFSRQRGYVQGAYQSLSNERKQAKGKAKLYKHEGTRKTFFELIGVAFFFGTSYGIMKGLFVFGNEELIAVRDLLNITSVILGSLAIFITTSIFRMDFRHLTYQIALPLMAAGFICFSLSSPFNVMGFALHQFGYQYFYIVIWALWPVLAHKIDAPAAQFACIGMMAIQSGQLVGSIIGSQLMVFATDRYLIAMISACVVFIILLIALFAFSDPLPKSGWGMLRPMEEDFSVSKFKRSCKKLAASRGLSARETEVFELLAKGRNCGYISSHLVISEGTTKTHIKNIYRKLGVHSQQALIDAIELDGKNS